MIVSCITASERGNPAGNQVTSVSFTYSAFVRSLGKALLDPAMSETA